MKIAYLFVYKGEKCTSVYNKVLSQVDEWVKQGAEVKLFMLTDGIELNHKNVVVIRQESFFKTIGRLYSELNKYGPDILYHRLWVLSPILVPALFSKYKLIAEINSDVKLELAVFKSQSVRGFITYLYDVLTRKFYYRALHGAVAVTNELAKGFENKVAVIPNSISVDKFSYRKSESQTGVPSVFFVGSPGYPWHGIDTLCKLAHATKGRLQFHVVGLDSSEVEDAPENVRFYGYLHVDKYSEIARNCAVGMGTLALHRKNLSEACPLKVREYLSAGLPVIIPYEETAFLSETPPWVLKVDASKDEFDDEQVRKILSFVEDMHHLVVPKSEVKPFIDSENLEARRVAFFKQVAKKGGGND
ncbi:glycosyltransferase [Pseudoalteromonas viridis]|uniref:Glycosyltransferase family 4 protein n=1 Tax=Pseudoalteromonas viridis TaxID=339617 RepID=A0ABX7V5E7_9GAMM|nr:glycosyltransferase [Pseudoalteromonas viridis]QTL36104.1 glycosyltransferase family 4 protein [Pseudoalteromonas viridis]